MLSRSTQLRLQCTTEQTEVCSFDSGDGARRDSDGYYWITGRVDDVRHVVLPKTRFQSVLSPCCWFCVLLPIWAWHTLKSSSGVARA